MINILHRKCILGIFILVSFASSFADTFNFVNNTNKTLQLNVDANKCYNYDNQPIIIAPNQSVNRFIASSRSNCAAGNSGIWLGFQVMAEKNNIFKDVGNTHFNLYKHEWDDCPNTGHGYYNGYGAYREGNDPDTGFRSRSLFCYGFAYYATDIISSTLTANVSVNENLDQTANITYTFTDGVFNLSATNNPGGLAVDSNGNIFIIDNSGAGAVVKKIPFTKISTNAGYGSSITLPSPKSGWVKLNGIALDQSGNIFLTVSGSKWLWEIKYDSNTLSYKKPKSLDIAPPNGGFNSPHGIATDLSGDVFIADSGNNQVVEFISDGNGGFSETTVLPSPQGGYMDPYGIAVGAYGSIYVTDAGSLNGNNGDAKVYKLMGDPRNGYTNPPTLISGEFINPLSITENGFTADLYVADAGANSISRIAWNAISMKYESPVANSSGVTFNTPSSIVYSSKFSHLFVSNENTSVFDIEPTYFWQ